MNQLIVRPTTAVDQMLDTERLLKRWMEGRSKHTVEAYRHDLRHFGAWAGFGNSVGHAIGDFLMLSQGEANEKVYAYRAHMLDSGTAPATINRRLASIRSVVNLASQFGMVGWLIHIKGVKQVRYRDTKGPTLEGMVAAKRAAAAHRFPAKAARDVAMLRVLYDLGLRRTELTTLDLEHLDIRATRLSILGKARLEREWKTLAPRTVRALEEWLRFRERKPGPLFTNFHNASKSGTRITPHGVNHVFREIGKAADVTLRPHGIRHSSITTALNLVKDPRAVQRHARHASLETTMIYDDNVEDLAGKVAQVVSEALEE